MTVNKTNRNKKTQKATAKRALGREKGRNASQNQQQVRRYEPRQKILDPCAADFASAFQDPFAWERPICLPGATGGMDSVKQRLFARGVGSTGTAGLGWVMFNPANVSDWASINFTNSTYTGDVSTSLVASAVGTTAQQVLGSVITSGHMLAGDAAAKPVLAALRVRNITQMMNRAGRTTAYCDMEDNNVIGNTVANLGSRPTAACDSFDGSWITLRLVGDTERICDWSNSNTYCDAAAQTQSSSGNQRPMIIAISSVGSTPQTFEWEAVYYNEVRWNALAQLATPTIPSESGDQVIVSARAAMGAADQKKKFFGHLKLFAIGFGKGFMGSSPEGGKTRSAGNAFGALTRGMLM